jgi:glycerophosphoryl diester phosphodiesterase
LALATLRTHATGEDMQIIGHRGARLEAPENTVAGFRHARSLGLNVVEFDVRMTADGNLVVIHDDSVDRTTNGSGRVADLTLAEIQALDARSIHQDWPEPVRVPSLAETLAAVRDFPTIMLEIKPDTPARLDEIVPRAVRQVTAHRLNAQVIILSFDPSALDLARTVAPGLRRSLTGAWNARSFLDQAIALGCCQIEARHNDADRELVNEARARGFTIGAWQTNTLEDLKSVLTLEPDVISSDNPSLIARLLAERGLADSNVLSATP